jgi:hypothetical protein
MITKQKDYQSKYKCGKLYRENTATKVKGEGSRLLGV